MTTTERWRLLSRRAKELIALSALSLLAVAIPVALVAQAAASGSDDSAAAPVPTPIVADAQDPSISAPTAVPELIGFESCTIINGLIPADPGLDGETDLCWALEDAGERPAACPIDGPYMFLDTNADGIVDRCKFADFSCEDGHPYDSDADGRADACLTLDQWVLSLAPTATPVPATPTVTPQPPATVAPQPPATATPRPPRPTVTPRPRPTAIPTREPYWSRPTGSG